MQIFCKRFKDLRVSKNLTLVEMGKELNVSSSTIMRWENGIMTPSIDHLYTIVTHFKISADYLIGVIND